MRKLVFIAICLALVAGCGGSDDYVSDADCEALCDKNLECNPDTNVTECVTECEQLKQLIRGEVYDAMAACTLDLPCESEQIGACLEDATDLAPEGASDGLMRAMCKKQLDCSGATGEMTVSECVDQAKVQAADYLQYFNAFKSSVLSCLSDCVSDLSCADLQQDDFMDPCMEECGIPTGEDGGGGD